MIRLGILLWAVMAMGCGGPPAGPDPAALEKEATQGREIRRSLEGTPAPKQP